MKNVQLSNTFKLLAGYIFVMMLFGVIRNEMISSVLDTSIAFIARISSHLTLVITGMISFIITGIVFLIPWIGVKMLDIEIHQEHYMEAVTNAILMLIVGEVVKAICLFIFLEDDLVKLAENFTADDLTNSSYFYISKYLDLLFVTLSVILYGILLKVKTTSTKASLFSVFFIIISISFVYIVFTY